MVDLALSTETKVRNLKLVTRVKQQILRLKISVHDAHLNMHIFNGLDKLAEVVSSESLRKWASFIFYLNEAEKVALLDQLQH